MNQGRDSAVAGLFRRQQIDKCNVTCNKPVHDRQFRLHPLKGELAGFWSVWVNGNWRVIFKIEDGNTRDVDLVDYH